MAELCIWSENNTPHHLLPLKTWSLSENKLFWIKWKHPKVSHGQATKYPFATDNQHSAFIALKAPLADNQQSLKIPHIIWRRNIIIIHNFQNLWIVYYLWLHIVEIVKSLSKLHVENEINQKTGLVCFTLKFIQIRNVVYGKYIMIFHNKYKLINDDSKTLRKKE